MHHMLFDAMILEYYFFTIPKVYQVHLEFNQVFRSEPLSDLPTYFYWIQWNEMKCYIVELKGNNITMRMFLCYSIYIKN